MKVRRAAFLRLMIAAAVLSVMLAVSAAWSFAQGGPGVSFTDRYVLAEGDQIEGDLFVVAQSVTLEAGSVVNGNVSLIGTDIEVRAQIRGDLVILGDHVQMGNGMYVTGSGVICGRIIHREQNVNVIGDYTASCDRMSALIGDVLPLTFDPDRVRLTGFDPSQLDQDIASRLAVAPPQISLQDHLLINGVWALIVGGLAGLITLVIPLRLRRVSDAALISPVATGAVGLLTLLVAGAVSGLLILSLILVVTACLMPFLALGWVALAVTVLIGWTALSLPVGVWLLNALNVQRISPFAAATVGAVVLTFTTGLLTLNVWTSLIYALLGLLLTSWGLGAVVLTRWGGQAFPDPTRRWASARQR